MGGTKHSKEPESFKKPPGKTGNKKSHSMIDDFTNAVKHKKQEYFATHLVHDDFREIMKHLKVGFSLKTANRVQPAEVHEDRKQSEGVELHDRLGPLQ